MMVPICSARSQVKKRKKYWEKEILKLVARWSSDVLSAANSQVTAHISLRACRVLLKAHLFYLNHYLFLYRACLVFLFSQNPASIQTFNVQFGQLVHFFLRPKNHSGFLWDMRSCLCFCHRIVFEENRAVLVVDVDQAGDHHKDEEAEDCNHNHLRTIRESVNKWMENSNNHLMTTREVQKSGKI